jgi:hypothetical protein
MFLAYVAASAVVAFPILLERTIEDVRFDDHLGTFPVEVGLCHNGRSTFDTGVLGKIYFEQTGPLGLGAYATSTGPPEAGGTLASYVDRSFLEANVAFIDDPSQIAEAYAERFSRQVRARLVRGELLIGIVGGLLLVRLAPHRRLRHGGSSGAVAMGVVFGALTTLTTAAGVVAWESWPCNTHIDQSYPLPGSPELSFSSPQAREVAIQVKPFVEKNSARIEEAADAYEAMALPSLRAELARQLSALEPLPGETIVIAEADPQGSSVGTSLRTAFYADLFDALGADSFALRTISGDVTSNGAVAEKAFVGREAVAAGDLPVVAVGGDHDAEVTWEQMAESGIDIPDFSTVEIAGLAVTGANDREHKSLFGGMVTNSSGITETDLGERVRQAVEGGPRVVLLHQPDAVAGYLGVSTIDRLLQLDPSFTTPYDDGVADVPGGVVNFGHLHEVAGPWVLWNTDGGSITWTLVDQLGTSGGVENRPTFDRFSTPLSVPLKPVSVRLQYVNAETGLATGFVTVSCETSGVCAISDRTDVGLPGGLPGAVAR